ncbi:MAG TPA: Lrp/AsnC family transcriptional regulator [Roseomonas sp.]|jgi:DNA-binding Lrp family transcriptional regulator
MHETVTLDAIDLRLLAALQADGRLTNQQAGERVGLSPSQCSRRRLALEAVGVIRGYHAELAAEALGLRLLVFVQVTLATHSRDNAQRFRELVSRLEEVQEAYAMTGDADYLLKAVVPDLKDLSALVNDVLLPHESVARVRSSIVLERLKESNRLPLAALRRG